MNERIKELAEQAEQYALDRANEGSDEDYDYAFDDDFRQKFAELIVLEICKELDKAQWDKGDDWVCADGTRIIPQIKQHFRVTE